MKETSSHTDQLETLAGEVSILRPKVQFLQREIQRLKQVVQILSSFVDKEVCVALLIDPESGRTAETQNNKVP